MTPYLPTYSATSLYDASPNTSDVIFISHTPMAWTCAPRLGHENSLPGHGDLQKISTCAGHNGNKRLRHDIFQIVHYQPMYVIIMSDS